MIECWRRDFQIPIANTPLVAIVCNLRFKGQHQASILQYHQRFQTARVEWNHSTLPVLHRLMPMLQLSLLILPTHHTNPLIRATTNEHRQYLPDMARFPQLAISINNTTPFNLSVTQSLKLIQFFRPSSRTRSMNQNHRLRHQNSSPPHYMRHPNHLPSRLLSPLLRPRRLIMLLRFIFKIRIRGR